MKNLLLILVLFTSFLFNLSAQQTYLETYGQAQIDLNRSDAIAQLDDTTFVLGGEWNGVGFLMKVNHKGELLDYFFLDNAVTGTSAVLDLAVGVSGNLYAVGECENCLPGDPLKKVFAVQTTPALLLVNSKIYDGVTPTNNVIYSPSIVSKGNQLMIAATSGGSGANLEDAVLLNVSGNLDTLWRKTFNSCGNCDSDHVADITATASGYAFLALNEGTDTLTLYHVGDNGNLIWKKRHYRAPGSTYSKLAFRSGVIYAGGSEQIAGANPANTGSFIKRFSESDGGLLGSMSLDFPGINDEVAGLQFANGGNLLAIHRRSAPNGIGGSYRVSRIYRINAAASQVIDFTEIPNPDVLTSIAATGIVPLTADGAEFAAGGNTGLFERSFFFSKNSVEPQPPGGIFDVSPDTACAPATIFLTNNSSNAVSHKWYLDGTVFSTGQNPGTVMIDAAGLHEIKLEVVTGSQNKITNFIVNNLPEIWNECPVCDNKPDPYLVIKNESGATLYTSGWVESYPPVTLPVNYTMSTSQNNKFEIWDEDNVGSNDFFGVFDIPGNTPGGTFSLIHPDDPDDPLSITFSTMLLTQTQTYTQTVLVYKPIATLGANDIMTATPGNPAPPFYTWQWYYNGEPIPGATSDTLAPAVGGSYAVAMVTPGCAALSNSVQFSPVLASVDITGTMPLCHGDSSGSLFASPVGGTPPYTYSWNPPNLNGNNPSGLPAGGYAVTVTDALGQTVSGQITLTEPDLLILASDVEHLSCAGDSSGAIVISPSGGTEPFSFSWDPSVLSGNNPTALAEGTYTVTVTDANGCTATLTETLEAPTALSATITSTPQQSGSGVDVLGTATVEPSGGTPPYTYLWSDPIGQISQTAVGLMWGNYTVTVTDANGCTLVDSVNVEFWLAAGEAVLPGFKIYPNPSSGVITIQAEAKGNMNLSVFDAAGREVLKQSLQQLPATLDFTELAGGIYFLWLETEQGWMREKMVLVR